MRSILENVEAYGLNVKHGLRWTTAKQILAANVAMTADMPVVMQFDLNGTNRTVVLPSITNGGAKIDGQVFLVMNVGATGTLTLNAHADDSSSGVAVLGADDIVLVVASKDQVQWLPILGASESAFFNGVTAGTVTASKALVVGASKELSSLGDIGMAEGGDFAFGTTTGTMLGTTGVQKLGFWGKTPAVQPSTIAPITTTQLVTTTGFGFATTAQANALLAAVNTLILDSQTIGLRATV